MFDALIINPTTRTALLRYIKHPSHAVMLVGPDGIGKGTLVQHTASAILHLPKNANLMERAEVTYVVPDEKGTISIEQIRAVQKAVRLKTAGSQEIRRAIIIEHAQCMTTEAQNALLKVLEEPPIDTIIMLTVGQLQDVLPTIQSRTQVLPVSMPQKEALFLHFEASYSTKQITQAYFLGGGLPGLMQALLDDDQTHPLVKSVELAKGLLRGQLFERMMYVEPIAKQRDQAIVLCEALERIAQAGLYAATDKPDTAKIRQWHAILKQSTQAKESLKINANTKLVLTNLLLQL